MATRGEAKGAERGARVVCIDILNVSDINNSREQRVILVHGFRGFSPQLFGLIMNMVGGACDGMVLPHGG